MASSIDIEKTLKLIANILTKGESCFLPGIGLLKAQYHPAVEKEHQIIPPFTSFSVEEDNRADAFHIIEEIKEEFEVNNDRAKSIWNETQTHLKSKLETGNKIQIPGVGYLEQKGESTLNFITSSSSFFQPIENPKEHLENPEYDIDPFPKEEKDYKKRKLLYTLLIFVGVIIVAGFFYIYYGTDLLVQHVQNTGEHTSTEDNTASSSASTSLSKDSVQQQAPRKTNDSLHFAIIYRKTTSKVKAIKDCKQKTKWGYQVAVYTKDSSSFLVGYPYYSLPKDTTEKIQEKHDIYGVKTWAIFPEKQGYHKIPIQP